MADRDGKTLNPRDFSSKNNLDSSSLPGEQQRSQRIRSRQNYPNPRTRLGNIRGSGKAPDPDHAFGDEPIKTRSQKNPPPRRSGPKTKPKSDKAAALASKVGQKPSESRRSGPKESSSSKVDKLSKATNLASRASEKSGIVGTVASLNPSKLLDKDTTKKEKAKAVAGAAAKAGVKAASTYVPGGQVLLIFTNKTIRNALIWTVLGLIIMLVAIVTVPATSMSGGEGGDDLQFAQGTIGQSALGGAAAADEQNLIYAASVCSIKPPTTGSATDATGGGLYAPPGTSDPVAEISGMKANQVMHAQELVAVTKEVGLSPADIEKAGKMILAAGWEESKYFNLGNAGNSKGLQPDQNPEEIKKSLTNKFAEGSPRDRGLNHDGDHGSIGVLQQQYPWWGSVDQLLNPRYAGKQFLTRLKAVPNWQGMDAASAVQAVQRSFSASGENYRRHQSIIDSLYAKIKDTPAGFNWSRYQGTPSGAGDLKPDGAAQNPAPASTGGGGAGPRRITGDEWTDPITGQKFRVTPSAGSPLPAKPEVIDEKNQSKSAVRAARATAKRWNEIKKIGGYRANDPGDHGKGDATDIMVPNWESDEGKKLGDAIAEFFMKHYKEYGINYIIWRQRIWQPGASSNPNGNVAWTPMSDRGDSNQNHMNHLHLSFFQNEKYDGGDVLDATDDGADKVIYQPPAPAPGSPDLVPGGSGGSTSTSVSSQRCKSLAKDYELAR